MNAQGTTGKSELFLTTELSRALSRAHRRRATAILLATMVIDVIP